MINIETIRRWWDVFVGDGGFTEVRILGKFSYSGYFKSVDNLLEAIQPYTEMDDEQIYFVLNDIAPSCYGRKQCEKFVKNPKITTNDSDIIYRRWVLCDFDPVRRSGTNATDEQLGFAHQRAQAVFRFLRDRGFNEPVICKSGNGYHCLYRIDTPVSDEVTEIIKGFFKYMGSLFTDDKVDFDEKNFNAARISKLYGTMAKKGANIEEMPWRMSDIVYVPADLKPTPIEKFKELADLLPKEEPKPVPNRRPYQGQTQFDLRTWLNEHGIVYKEEKQGESVRFTLEYCPWVDTHSDKKKWDSALFLDPDGKVTFNCHHSHCKNKTWHEVRLFYEPNAYDRPVYQPQPMQPRQYAPQKPKYEIKQETPELGKKWLQLADIEKVDLSAIPRVKTGFAELDRLILGLAEGELSVLSGGNASGKTSLLDTIILSAIEQHVPTAAYSGELPSYIFKSWLQMAAAGRDNLMPSKFGDGKFFVPNNVGERIDRWMTDKFFLYNNEYGNSVEEVMHDMEELLELGVKLFILDNMMSLDLEALEGGNSNVKQKSLIVRLKDFAKDNKVHVIVVAHPRKTTAFLRKNDISGTGDITNVADNVFIAHRVNQDFLKAGAEFYGQGEIMRFQGFGNVIEISKNRMYGVCDVLVGLHYEIESRRFKNTEYEDIHYGWEAAPEQRSFWNEPEHYEVYAEGQPEMPFAEYQGDDAPPF